MIWIPLLVVFLIALYASVHITVLRKELKWRAACNNWEDERFIWVSLVFEAARTTTRTAIVHSDLKNVGDYQLNFDTLRQMTTLMVEQEEERAKVSLMLKRKIEELETWEKGHPPPAPPSYRGRRLLVGSKMQAMV